MKKYSFTIYGHPNITGKHFNTIEFTKEEEISKKADCIIGVKADFSLNKLKSVISKSDKIKIIINSEIINADINPGFNDKKEIVIRKSNFLSKRTLGIRADKASLDLKRNLIDYLKNPDNKIIVKIIVI